MGWRSHHSHQSRLLSLYIFPNIFMKSHYLLIALTIGTFILPATKTLLVSAQAVQLTQNNPEENERKVEVQSIAAKVTVRIKIGQGNGSGVLIAKKGNTYLVMTNAHVVRERGSITLQTPDRQSYAARKVQNTQVGNFDVALLEFTSTRAYQLAGLDNFGKNAAPVMKEGREVFAAGFPFDSNALKFVIGEVKQLPQEPFTNGTQIGYVTKGDIEQGMSGGPILDSSGNLVGINSTLAYPIKPAYTYADGRKAPTDLAAEYQQANWGVPMYNLLTRLNPDVLYSYKQLPKLHRTVTPSGYMAELDRKARQVTVRIENSNENGSGVIVAQDGNSYYVLTAEHVVKSTDKLRITTHDQRTYTVSPSQITRAEGTDLAVVKFTSTQPYQVATLGNYDISNDAVVFPGGWPAPQKIRSQQWQWQLNPGVISNKEQGEFQTQDKVSFSSGYDLVYSSITYGGMSGGPVFDRAGQVIGIHGKAEGNRSTENISGNILGNSLGISIKTFIGLADQLKLNPRSLQIASTAPAALDGTKLASINLVRSNIAIPSNDSDANQWIEYGNQLHRLGKDADAVKAFDRAIALQPDLLDAHYGKGLALSADRDNPAALRSFDRAIQLVPADNQSSYYYLWKYRSVALRELGKDTEALVAVSQAIDLEPQDLILLNEQAALLEQLKRYSEAIAVYDKIIAKEPKAWAYSNRGMAKSGLGDNKGAFADYDTAIRINPQFAKSYSNRGVLKAELGDKKGAIADFETAIRFDSQFAAPYSNRGLAKSELGDKKGAIADFETAIRINPRYAEPYSNRGIVKSELGDSKGAMSDFDTAIRINPRSDKAYYNRGRLKYMLEDNKGAIADYDTAVQINPKFALAYLNRGAVKQKSGDKKGALADYDSAILITPQDAKIYYNRGSVRDQLGDKKGALADYDTAIQIDPKDAKTYYRRGAFKSGLIDNKGALADYHSAIRINPQYAEAYFGRGTFKYKSGDKKGALADFNAAAQIFKSQNNMVFYSQVVAIIQMFDK
jgi:tetratricopeptide (TPR) repeat protein/S1-C subfamily serine protease